MTIPNKKTFQYDSITIGISIFTDDGTKLKIDVKNDALMTTISEVFDFGHVSVITSLTSIVKDTFVMVCKNNFNKQIEIWKFKLVNNHIPVLFTVPFIVKDFDPNRVHDSIFQKPIIADTLSEDNSTSTFIVPYFYIDYIPELKRSTICEAKIMIPWEYITDDKYSNSW